MKILKNIKELKTLGIGDKFGFITNGEVSYWAYAGISPLGSGQIVIAVNNSSWINARTFDQSHFTNSNIFVTGEDDGNFIGELMIEQLNNEIRIIEKIYIKKKL